MTKSKQTISHRAAKSAAAPKRPSGISRDTTPGVISAVVVYIAPGVLGDAPISVNDTPLSPILPGKTTKLTRLVDLLRRHEGATLAELCAATGWQVHSVRGALAGTLKRKGYTITSEKIDAARRYRVAASA